MQEKACAHFHFALEDTHQYDLESFVPVLLVPTPRAGASYCV